MKILQIKEDRHEELKMKYDSTLVILEEYNGRLTKRDNEIKSLKDKISELRKQNASISEEKNDLKIELVAIGRTVQQIENKVRYDVQEKTKSIIKNYVIQNKGNISKKKIIYFIESLTVDDLIADANEEN
ncbi:MULTISPECIES: hypothetical protein [unclassified Breznakia]|uniref:hypothetical protein n=1 Tax=unclassified Breznakia TaxID=2623764 RepID=UPI0024771F3A|nr:MULTISPECIES: hypothetical protein [unclassified Breznakia]MDH6367150.1 putative nucleic acid-binding Zn-ribbon protein [Breznakia sp. PH1-1]MDH6404263.1 putative nucleic acid-binding Zn-ribbon protein [Breznakia sp. PF1-11]MDH6412038.1 putative nucleic acid-binding Zn-ribbon protein [Breznakia sp. PFB1-11]MDH6414251.1 putative nucleic acid-binding Zn-ribbon protein [Breznakia sp. PFB1-14]MDH6416652.1 putative nucleic acid-binding Zn-ribbon protein [Breznakia sp. PFB1-4]